MKALNGYDYLVVIIYMVLMVWIGLFFIKHIKGGADYFRAGNKLTWWIGGFSSFMTAFSAWMFTGGAGIVYTEGLTGAFILGMGGLGVLAGYLYFARRWRRSRVTTLMEFLEERFNLPSHQVASWFYVLVQVLYSATVLYSLGIFISIALGLNLVLVIWACGVAVLLYTLLGGIWSVSVTDTVQFLVLVPVCLAMIPLSLIEIGGMSELYHSAPPDFFSFPSQGHPWHWLLAYLLLVIHGQNTNPIVQRYFSVRDEGEAKKVALLCMALFIPGVFLWALPPMAARVIYPTLQGVINLQNPEEGSYVVMAMRVLPHGLLGMLIAAIFTAAISSLDSVYNVVSAVISKDILQRVFKCSLSDRALLRAGHITTIAVGLIVILVSLAMAGSGEGVFTVMMTVASLTITPLATPMLLGFIFRKPPAWSFLSAFTCSTICAAMFAFYPPLKACLKMFGGPFVFSVQSLAIFLVGTVAFFLSIFLFRSTPEERQRIDGFFAKLGTPVDMVNEIPGHTIDNTAIVRLIGKLSFILGCMVSIFVFFPGTLSERLINLAVGFSLLGIGVWLHLGSPREGKSPPINTGVRN